MKLFDRGITRSYVKILLPTTLSMVMYSLYCFADMFFVAISVGNDGLAALNVALPVFNIFAAIGILFGVGAAITVTVLKVNDNAEADRAFTMSMVVLAVIAIVLEILFFVFLDNIVYMLGADEILFEHARDYLFAVGFGLVAYTFMGALTVLVRSDFNAKLAMTAGLVGNVVNIVLDYVLTIPIKMGMFGIGLATAIGPAVSFLILCLHFITKKNHMHFVRFKFKLKLLLRTLKNGISASVLELSTGVVTLVTNLTLMRISGGDAVAIFGVIVNIAFIAKNIFAGAAQAGQPLISYNYARGDGEKMRCSINITILSAALIGAVCTVIMLIFAPQIMGAFLKNSDALVQSGVVALRIYYSLFVFIGVNTAIMYSFQSVEKSGYAVLMSVLRSIVFIPVTLLTLPLIWGLNGVWLSMPVAEAVTLIIFALLAIKLFKKVNRQG